MRQLGLILLLLIIGPRLRGQENDFDLGKLKFRGVAFITSKQTITKSFGQGKRVETNYECGFFTNDQAGGPYYQLVYPDFNYIGSDKDDFFLENVDFDVKGKVKIAYGEKQLSGLTTKDDFIKMFGEKISENFVKQPGTEVVLMYSKDSDDGAVFIFKDGRLIKFEYWTPC